MFNIKEFFEKFRNIEKGSKERLEVIIKTIKWHTKIELSIENLEVGENNIKLKCNPVFKNEIFMKKEVIEEDLRNQKIYLKLS